MVLKENKVGEMLKKHVLIMLPSTMKRIIAQVGLTITKKKIMYIMFKQSWYR